MQATLEEKGATVGEFVLYSADAQNFTAEVNKIAAAKPDALVLVALRGDHQDHPAADRQGHRPAGHPAVLRGRQHGRLLGGELRPRPASRAPSRSPAEVDQDVQRQAARESNPKLKDFTYGPQSYDATVIIALAAIAAGTTPARPSVPRSSTSPRTAPSAPRFEECAKLLEDGEDIDYEGASGPTDMNDTGSPIAGTIGIQQYTKGNTYKQVDSVSGVVN